MAPLHPFWKLPLELRLIIYELCDIRALAKFARAYASSNAKAYRDEIEQRFYSRHLMIGNHAALSRAIKVSRHHPTAACGTVAKLQAYGQFNIDSKPTSAFDRVLNGFISTHNNDHTFEEAILVTAARQGHPSLFRMLFEAQFLATTSPNEEQRPKEVTLEGTQLIQHQPWRRHSAAPGLTTQKPGLTTQKPDVTALGYAFRRSLSKKYYDGPEMLCTVLDCARLLVQQLAEEGESLQARAMNGSISLDEASELSIDLGLRSQTAYLMGHLLTIGDADVIVPFHAPGCLSILTALAWFADPMGLLPRQLSDYRAIVDYWCIGEHEAFTPLLGAIDSVSKREFDLIMGLGGIDLDLSRSAMFNNRRLSTPIMMAISGCTRLRDISRGRPARTVYATRVEMLEALLQHGADPNLPNRRVFHGLPLTALVGQIWSAVREIGTDAFPFAYQATEALLNAGADPLKETPYGLCPLYALLRSMHESRRREVPSLYSRRRTRAMFEGELQVRILGQTLQQFFEHRPNLLTAIIPGIDSSAVGFAVAEGNNQLADYLHSLGAS